MLTTIDEQVARALLQERLLAAVSSFFAILAVLLACVGLYGLLAYTVVRRTREIGVRMALGATRQSVMRTIVGEALMLVLAGIAIGIPCTMAIGRFSRSLLYGLAPSDPATILAAGGGFLAVAAAAALWPAMRASSIEPMQALRHD
jgi:ABC-type antimicrobial peptide transport system permease subunit